MRFHLCLAAGFLAAASVPAITVVTVTNTHDTGVGSFRQAVIDANTIAGFDKIVFNIPGSDENCGADGVCTIGPVTNLPAITEGVEIDGYSQPGAQANTAAQGSNALIKIVLSGVNDTDASTRGLEIQADNSVVSGLAIGGFQYGIRVPFVSGVKITGCFVGTDAAGETASPNQW